MRPHAPPFLPVLRPLALVALAALAAGCTSRPGGGRLEASWRDRDAAKPAPPRTISAPAKAAWCPGWKRLEVTAVQEDLGFGLAIYPAESLVPGGYPAVDPGFDSVARPGAAGVARWFGEQTIEGLQSDSGALQLTRNDGRYDASFGFRLRSLDGVDTIRVTGRARGLVPGPCPVDSVPATTPQQ
jgi:hypothetical protein